MKRLALLLLTSVVTSVLTAGFQADAQVAGDFQTLTFANVMENALKNNCLGCHSAPVNKGEVNLETYANVFAVRAEITETVTSGEMPRKSIMDPQSKDLLLRWIAAGAPEVTDQRMN